MTGVQTCALPISRLYGRAPQGKRLVQKCRTATGRPSPSSPPCAIQGAFVLDLLARLFAVVSLVTCDSEGRSRCVQHIFDGLAVVDLSAGHREVQRPAFAVDDRMDLGRSAATADADRLILLPPFAPLAARWAFTIVLSIRYRLSRDFDASASKIRFQMPRRDHRLKRLYAVVYGP